MSRRLGVVIPTAGSVYVSIEVDDDFDETNLDAVYDAALDEIDAVACRHDGGDIDIEHEWDYYRRITQGNVRFVPHNEVEVISDESDR